MRFARGRARFHAMGTESTARLDRLYDGGLKWVFGFDSDRQSLTAFTLSASRLLRVARDGVDFGNGYDRVSSTLCYVFCLTFLCFRARLHGFSDLVQFRL
jgi:hypothetical protein